MKSKNLKPKTKDIQMPNEKISKMKYSVDYKIQRKMNCEYNLYKHC